MRRRGACGVDDDFQTRMQLVLSGVFLVWDAFPLSILAVETPVRRLRADPWSALNLSASAPCALRESISTVMLMKPAKETYPLPVGEIFLVH